MEKQDKSEFGQAWEKAFADAEKDVSPSVWEKIESGIVGKERWRKRGFLTIQLLAAASITFALSVGGVAIYTLSTKTNGVSGDTQIVVNENRKDEGRRKTGFNEIVENDKLSDKLDLSDEILENTGLLAVDNPTLVAKAHKEVSESDKKQARAAVGDKAGPLQRHDAHDAGDAFAKKTAPHTGGTTETIENLLPEPQAVDRLFAYLETAPLAKVELHMVPWYNYSPSGKNNGSKEIWAGIGFSTGSFDPNPNVGNSSMETLSFDSNSNSDETPMFSEEKRGQTFNMGVNFGTQLTEKWLLQSGIVYTQQQTTSNSNMANFENGATGRALSDFITASSVDNVAFIAPYDIDNTYELISVPIQVGYALLDKKFSIILLSGVSNNILIRNQLSPRSGQLGDTIIPSGEDSRYRTYQLGGLIGSEFNYNLGSHYRFSIVPQFRHAINSVTKSEDSSRPTSLELGFRFKYIFNN